MYPGLHRTPADRHPNSRQRTSHRRPSAAAPPGVHRAQTPPPSRPPHLWCMPRSSFLHLYHMHQRARPQPSAGPSRTPGVPCSRAWTRFVAVALAAVPGFLDEPLRDSSRIQSALSWAHAIRAARSSFSSRPSDRTASIGPRDRVRPYAARPPLIVRVRHDASVRVTIPRGGSRAEAARFVRRQMAWIARERERVLAAHVTRAWTDAATLMLRGELVVIQVRLASDGAPTIRYGERTVVVPEGHDIRRCIETTCAHWRGTSSVIGCARWPPRTSSRFRGSRSATSDRAGVRVREQDELR